MQVRVGCVCVILVGASVHRDGCYENRGFNNLLTIELSKEKMKHGLFFNIFSHLAMQLYW